MSTSNAHNTQHAGQDPRRHAATGALRPPSSQARSLGGRPAAGGCAASLASGPAVDQPAHDHPPRRCCQYVLKERAHSMPYIASRECVWVSVYHCAPFVCVWCHPPCAGSSSPASSCGGNLIMSVEERRRNLASLPESMRRMSLDNSALDATMFRNRIPAWERGQQGGEAQAAPTILEETHADGTSVFVSHGAGFRCSVAMMRVVELMRRWHTMSTSSTSASSHLYTSLVPYSHAQWAMGTAFWRPVRLPPTPARAQVASSRQGRCGCSLQRTTRSTRW